MSVSYRIISVRSWFLIALHQCIRGLKRAIPSCVPTQNLWSRHGHLVQKESNLVDVNVQQYLCHFLGPHLVHVLKSKHSMHIRHPWNSTVAKTRNIREKVQYLKLMIICCARAYGRWKLQGTAKMVKTRATSIFFGKKMRMRSMTQTNKKRSRREHAHSFKLSNLPPKIIQREYLMPSH